MRTLMQKQNRPHSSLHLQRTIGNQAVPRLPQVNTEGLEVESNTTATTLFGHDFSRIPVYATVPKKAQTKPAVNTPGDIYEQEADRVADQVMRMPEPKLQRACACGGECAKCQKERLTQGPERLKTMRLGSNDPGQPATPSIIHETLRSPGQPLDATTRTFFEPRFGWDFSRVRIHADAQAAQSAKSINARAYTLGNEIAFGSGEYQPTTTQGRRLLAHELAHVVQQEAGPVDGAPAFRGVQLSHPSDRFEREADSVAAQILRMKDLPVTGVSRPPRWPVASASSVRSIQRMPEEAEASRAGEPTQAPSETDDKAQGSKEAAARAIDKLSELIEIALERAKDENCKGHDQNTVISWVSDANNTRFSMRTLFHNGDYDGVLELYQGEMSFYKEFVSGKCGCP